MGFALAVIACPCICVCISPDLKSVRVSHLSLALSSEWHMMDGVNTHCAGNRAIYRVDVANGVQTVEVGVCVLMFLRHLFRPLDMVAVIIIVVYILRSMVIVLIMMVLCVLVLARTLMVPFRQFVAIHEALLLRVIVKIVAIRAFLVGRGVGKGLQVLHLILTIAQRVQRTFRLLGF